MKKGLLVTGAVLILCIVAGTMYFVVTKKSTTGTDGGFGLLPGSHTVLPTGDGQTPRMSIKGADGTEVLVNDFLALPETKEDPDNPGYYNLGNQPTETAPYLISYIPATTFFNIGLLKEPIGQSRLQVEAYLSNILGLSKDELCTLNYSISVPNSVNSNYSGMNLGFSFCPGAVKLP